jgi:hypothetical protein
MVLERSGQCFLTVLYLSSVQIKTHVVPLTSHSPSLLSTPIETGFISMSAALYQRCHWKTSSVSFSFDPHHSAFYLPSAPALLKATQKRRNCRSFLICISQSLQHQIIDLNPTMIKGISTRIPPLLPAVMNSMCMETHTGS